MISENMRREIVAEKIGHFIDLLRLRGYSKKTIKSYVLHVSRFLYCCTGEISEDVTKRYLLELMGRNRNVSVRLVVAALRLYLSKIEKRDFALSIDYPKKEKSLPVVLTKEEVVSMIGATENQKHRLILEMLYSSGLRLNELKKLKFNDVNFENASVHVKLGKGGKDRIVFISKNLVLKLKEYIALVDKNRTEEIYLFSGRDDKMLSARTIQAIVKNAAERAKISKNVHPHTLRHSFATHLLEQGTDIRYIQRLLGHADLRTTEVYTKVTDENLKRIVNPLDVLYAEREATKQAKSMNNSENKKDLYNAVLSLMKTLQKGLSE